MFSCFPFVLYLVFDLGFVVVTDSYPISLMCLLKSYYWKCICKKERGKCKTLYLQTASRANNFRWTVQIHRSKQQESKCFVLECLHVRWSSPWNKLPCLRRQWNCEVGITLSKLHFWNCPEAMCGQNNILSCIQRMITSIFDYIWLANRSFKAKSLSLISSNNLSWEFCMLTNIQNFQIKIFSAVKEWLS